MKFVNVGKSRSELEEEFDIPYCPLAELEADFSNLNDSEEKKEDLIMEGYQEKNGLNEMLCGLSNTKKRKEEMPDNKEMSARSLKGTPKKLNFRRQSLDVLWNSTAGEKVKEILSQSIMKLNISSFTERKASDSKFGEGSDFYEVSAI